MENEEMTNDAAVAWVVVDQTLRKDSPDPNFMNGAYWTSFETVSADRALSVVKERQSIRPTGEYEVIALVPATTVAELRARAESAERQVAACKGVLVRWNKVIQFAEEIGYTESEIKVMTLMAEELAIAGAEAALTKETP